MLALRDQQDTEQLGTERPHGPALLRHLVDTARRNAEREGIVRLYAVLSAESVTDEHPAQACFRDRYTGLRAFVTDAVIAVMDGLQVQWLLDPGSVEMAASTDLVIRSLLGTPAPERFSAEKDWTEQRPRL